MYLHEDRYFDITIEYAKAAEDDILIRATIYKSGTGSGLRFICCQRSGFAIPGVGAEDKRRPNVRVGSDHSEVLGVIEASHDALGGDPD